MIDILGQDGEIDFLIRNNLIKSKGRYLDIGSADAYINSNTAYLDSLGWQGICIEPNPSYEYSYMMRSCQLVQKAVNTYSGICRFEFSPIAEIGKINPVAKDEVECIDIKEFDKPVFDLISIDVEGMEYELMKYFINWPELIIFEYNTLGVHDYRLAKLLTEKGFIMLHKTAFNFIYKCR